MLSTLTENVNKLTQAADTEKEPDVKLEAIADEKIVFSTTSSTSDENQVLLDGVNLHQVCHVPLLSFLFTYHAVYHCLLLLYFK